MTNDHLHHLPAIAGHLGMKPDAVRHLHRTRGLPLHRMGRTVYANRSEIDQWLAAQRARPMMAVAAE